MTKSNDMLATGALLAQDKLDQYRELGAFGGPVWQSAVQMRAMLVRLNRRHCADYFARPSFDPEQKVLRWTSEAPGTAVAWDAMSPEDQAERALDLEVVRSDLLGLVQELKAKGDQQPGSAASFASLLEQAMKTPARGNFLYFVGKQPVIAFWGFENQESGTYAVAEAPPIYAESPAIGTAAQAPPQASVVSTPPKRRPWWLWLLGLLLLLLLLLFVLRSCAPQALPPFLGTTAVDKKLDAETQRNDATGQPRTDGSVRYDASGNAIRDGSAAAGDAAALPPGTEGKDTAQDAKAEAPLDPQAGKDQPPPAKEMPDPNAPKNGPDDQKEKDKANPPPVDAKPDDAAKKSSDKSAAAPMTDPPDLDIPKDPKAAQKMDFLQGQWKTGAGLVDTADKKPVDVSFDIGKDGKGEATYRKSDGTVCKAPIQGVMNGGKVAIEGKSQIPCSGGGSFQAPRIECERNKRGETECSGVNADKSTFTTRVQKQP